MRSRRHSCQHLLRHIITITAITLTGTTAIITVIATTAIITIIAPTIVITIAIDDTKSANKLPRGPMAATHVAAVYLLQPRSGVRL